MIRRRRLMHLGLSLGILFAGGMIMSQGHASALSNQYPDSALSAQNANVLLVNGSTRYVQDTEGRLAVWFKTNHGTVTIHKGNFCNTSTGDLIETEDTASWGMPNGTPITHFTLFGSGNSSSADGKKGVNCESNITLNISGLTFKENNYYVANLDIKYVGPGGHWPGVMNYFWVSASGADSLVGLRSTNGGNNSGHAATIEQTDTSPNYVDYRAHFGTDCSVNGSETAQLVFYDLDNGGGGGAQPAGHNVSIRVHRVDAGHNGYVSFTGSSGGTGGTSTTWIPATRQNTTQSVNFNAQRNAKYVLEMNNVYYNNTFQYSLPYSQVYSVQCPTAKIDAKASTPKSTVKVNNPVTFYNWAAVTGAKNSDPDTFKVKITDEGPQNIPDRADWGPVEKPIKNGNYPNDKGKFTFTPTQTGKYCRKTTISSVPTRAEVNYSTPHTTAQVCVRVTSTTPTDIPDKYITLTPTNWPDSAQTETQENTTFEGQVAVNGFPTPVDGGWGYDELSQRLDPIRVTASARYDTLDQRTREVTVYTCPSGYSPRHPTSGGGRQCSKEVSETVYTCPDGFSPTHPSSGGSGACSKDGYEWVGATKGADGNWKCPSRTVEVSGSGSSKTCKVPVTRHRAPSSSVETHTEYSAPDTSTKTEYSYKCEYQGASAWSAYGDWGVNAPDCKPYWTCPGGAVVDGSDPLATGGYYNNAPDCNGWKCQYSPYTQVNRNRNNPPTCQYRCNGGTGSPAYYDNGDAKDADRAQGSGNDRRCFEQPTFRLECAWLNTDEEVVATQAEAVSNDGNYCRNPVSLQGDEIGNKVCANLTIDPEPEYPDSWTTRPLPGVIYNSTTNRTQTINRWMWTVNTTTPTCTDVVGFPYLKVFGSDVRVGGGLGATDTSCAAYNNTAAGISTRSNAAYLGAGAQYAAMAVGAISGFVSAQYSGMNASPRTSYAPRELSFANTDGSLYGGNWGAGGVPACVGYVSNLPAGHTNTYNADTTVNRPLIGTRTTLADHVVGHDAYISNNIRYAGGWGTIKDIPQYQLVVEGDIYIGAGVTQLDGLYVALPRSNGTGGHIYTCATGIRSAPTTTLSGCESQLVVNGSMVARDIYFMRDCGSLHYAEQDEPNPRSYNGSTGDTEACGGDSHAAEVFNYSPELWLKSLNSKPPDTYDSISSLPPIL